MKIYLTRHGQTVWNTQGKMQGWNDSPLTELGINNARSLGESLQNIHFDHIYSSPSKRAYDTANYIKGNRDITIITKDELKEMGFGTWEGMLKKDVEELYKEQIHNFWNTPHLYQPVDGETFDELFTRVKLIFKDITKEPSDETILIVTHTVVIKAIYYILKGYPLSEFWSLPYIHDTSLTVIEVDEKGVHFKLEADLSHLNTNKS